MSDKQFLSELLGLVREAEERKRQVSSGLLLTLAERRYEELKPLMRRAAMKGRDRIYAEFHPNSLLMNAVRPMMNLVAGDVNVAREQLDCMDILKSDEVGWLYRACTLRSVVDNDGLHGCFSGSGERSWPSDLHATDYQALRWGFLARHFTPHGGTYLEIYWR